MDDPADETRTLVTFTLSPVAFARWTEALRRARYEGAKSDEAQVLAIVEGFQANAARRSRE